MVVMRSPPRQGVLRLSSRGRGLPPTIAAGLCQARMECTSLRARARIPQLEDDLQVCANRRDLAVRESAAKGGLGDVADNDLPDAHIHAARRLLRIHVRDP